MGDLRRESGHITDGQVKAAPPTQKPTQRVQRLSFLALGLLLQAIRLLESSLTPVIVLIECVKYLYHRVAHGPGLDKSCYFQRYIPWVARKSEPAIPNIVAMRYVLSH